MAISKAQIISAFNEFHSENIEDILFVQGGISVGKNGGKRATTSFVTGPDANSAQQTDSVHSVKLTGLEMNELTISFKHSALEVEISKPMAFDYPDSMDKCDSWEDVREVLVHMAEKAAEARGVSAIVLREVQHPTNPLNILLIGTVFMLCYGIFDLDQLYNWFAMVPILKYLVLLKPYHAYITYGTFLIHLMEIRMLLLPRLEKYRVSTDYAIEWSLWLFLDGYASISRFDGTVERIKKGTKYWKC